MDVLASATSVGRLPWRRRCCWCVCALLLPACGPSPEDLVERLAGNREEREAARQELLLAKDRAVGPLLAALEDANLVDARPQLVEVLASLATRVEDPRIMGALVDHLRTDLDPGVRARIARFLGMHRRADGVEGLLGALEDRDGEVRHQALLGLSELKGKLSQAQQQTLQDFARAAVADGDPGVRLEAMIQVEVSVSQWLQEASEATLKAQLPEADSLYAAALAYAPHSKRAQYRLGRFYYDNGESDKGMRYLREYGMLLDVPHLSTAPDMDGRPDDAVWREAARTDSFFSLSMGHAAALPTENTAEMWIGRTDEDLHIGFRGHDEHPDSLVVTITSQEEADGYRTGPVISQRTIWTDDIIELFIDPNFDHRTYAHVGINSLGMVADEWITGRLGSEGWNRPEWRPDAQAATHVGEDFWSIEYRLGFDEGEFPRPGPGTIWGYNMVRVYRGQEYSQWVRTYSGGHSPDDFGMLVF